ncbi:hypothetical protein AB0E59_47775 [Lentzea sp. NPDC034063]|uniref:hypothetical protein n=1 Tax=unclassified Lentzea TaxID=2643253 RepID=UPI0033FAABE9
MNRSSEEVDHVKGYMKKAAVVVFAGALMFATATAASANQAGVRVDGKERGYGGVNNHGNHVYACDTRSDNWGVRTRFVYVVSGGGQYEDVVGDGNGSTTGCGVRDLPLALTAVRFNVCAGVSGADTGCTGWIEVDLNDRAAQAGAANPSTISLG